MNICFVLNYAPHYRTEIYLKIEKELNAKFYFANETLAQNIKKVDYSLFQHLPVELNFIKLIGNFNWITGSIRLILKKEFNKFVIVGEPFCLSSWFMMILARVLGKKIYTWTHGWYGREHGFKKLLKQFYFSIPNGIFLYGDWAKGLMVNVGFNPQKLHVIYNSLNYSRHIKLRNGLNRNNIFEDLFKNSFATIVFVGRVTPQKRIELLIHAQKISHSHNHPFNVAVVGDCNFQDDLMQEVSKMGMESFWKFLGPCYDEEKLSSYFFNADLCVSPGELGLTGIHSMSFGTPVITHNNFSEQMPEFESIIKDMTGDFFQQDDANDLSHVIDKWLIRFPSKATEIINNCFAVIDTKYNPQFQISIFKKVLLN